MELRQLNYAQWEEAWAELPEERREVYFHPRYAELCGVWENAAARCLAITGDDRRMLYPYLVHPIDDAADVQTPYGYGGPLFIGRWELAEQIATLTAVVEIFAKEDTVAEFVRCHTEWSDAELLAGCGYRTFQVRTNVECDLSDEDFSKGWSSGARRNLRKAQGCGLRHRLSRSFEDLQTFERLYAQTAQRLDMAAAYRFDHDYFQRLIEVPGVRLIIVECEGKPIAAAIVFIGGRLAHYHLGASDFEHQDRRPNDFLYYAMASTAREAGCQRIIWGGGMSNDPADSLFRFKTHFGANQKPVFCAGRVLNAGKYEELCQQWQERNPGRESKLFLKYRA